jgi:archaellum component FlaC
MVEPTLELLQAMVQKVLDNQHRQSTDIHDIRDRITHIEGEIGKVVRDRGDDMESRAHIHARVDRISERLDRIERRLELREE